MKKSKDPRKEVSPKQKGGHLLKYSPKDKAKKLFSSKSKTVTV